jgi:hypothetical protein
LAFPRDFVDSRGFVASCIHFALGKAVSREGFQGWRGWRKRPGIRNSAYLSLSHDHRVFFARTAFG